MNNVTVAVHRTNPEGFRFFRSFLSWDGKNQFSCIKLAVKTDTDDKVEFDFYFDVDHKDPITIHFGEDALVIPGKEE
jgi:hypothetical protein